MRCLRFAIVAWVGLALGSAAPSAAEELGRYHALVIGSNDYEYLPRLQTAVNDASAVHDVLSRQYGYESTLLLNPTRQELILAFDRLRAVLTENDNLLIFYAGHGYLDRATDEGFWLTVKAKEDSQVEWLPVSTVTRLLKASLVKHALVVVDSCYSGTLTRDAPVLLATGAARAAEIERLNRKRARKALTSGGLEPVYDGGGDGYSVFTRALLENLRDNAEVLDGFQLYTRLRKAVVLNAEQTPQYGDIRLAGDEGGDFLFVPTARQRAAAPPAPAPAPNTEILFWQSIQDSTAASDYEAYLAQYPDGAFAMLARARAERYGKQAAAPAAATPPAASAVEIAFWDSIKDSRKEADFSAYLQQYPDGQFAALARLRRQELKPPPAPQPVPAPAPERAELEPVEAFYVLAHNANVRQAPTVESAAVTTLPSGSELYVAGRTRDGQWRKVVRDGAALGYIYAPLLQERAAWNQARREEEARQAAAPAAAQRRPPAVAPPPAGTAEGRTAATDRTAATPSPAPAAPAARTAALAPPPPDTGRLAAYLQDREKEFLSEIRRYDYKNRILARATTSSQGSVPVPTNIARYEILGTDGNRLKLSILVDLSASYAGGDGPVDARLVLWVEPAPAGADEHYTIVGHE